jgi:hypothetical protein
MEMMETENQQNAANVFIAGMSHNEGQPAIRSGTYWSPHYPSWSHGDRMAADTEIERLWAPSLPAYVARSGEEVVIEDAMKSSFLRRRREVGCARRVLLEACRFVLSHMHLEQRQPEFLFMRRIGKRAADGFPQSLDLLLLHFTIMEGFGAVPLVSNLVRLVRNGQPTIYTYSVQS